VTCFDSVSELALCCISDRLTTHLNSVLVIKDDQNRPQEYSISGIAQLQGAQSGGEHLLVPPHRTRACIGAPEKPPSDWPVGGARVFSRKAIVAAIPVPHPFSDLKPEASRLEGYAVHSRCWTLMEKYLGSQAIARLDLVVSTLQEQWGLLIDHLEHQPADADSLDLFGAFARYQGWTYPGPAECDPLHIPEISNIFRQSVSSRTRQKKKDLANGTVRRLFTKRGVPPEIIFLIAEHLEVTDARNMEIAFGEQLPVNYWRKRILDIYVEADDVDADRVDWGYLAMRLDMKIDFKPMAFGPFEKLSERLWNRKRIMDMLRPVKQRVLQEIHLQVGGL
jgi:hypothetical protein